MHNLRGRHNRLCRIVRRVKILHNPFGHTRRRPRLRHDGCKRPIVLIRMRIKRRHIDSRDFRDLTQEGLLVRTALLCRTVACENLRRDVLALANGEKINEISKRLRIDRADAARKHHVLQPMPILRQERHMRKLQHVEHARVAHLIAQRERNQVKILHRIVAFQRKKWDIILPQLLLHVAPGRKHTLTPHAGHFIHHAIKNPHADIRHPDLIRVRKTERNTQIDILFIFDDLIIFSTHIARRLLHGLQDPMDLICHKHSFCFKFTCHSNCFCPEKQPIKQRSRKCRSRRVRNGHARTSRPSFRHQI